MNTIRALMCSLALVPCVVLAQSGWRDMQGNPLPETAASKSSKGFSGSLVVTPDRDWQEKWNTSPETVPHFSEAKRAKAGEELYILAFLSNPGVDSAGMANVTCDFIVARPDGSRSVDEMDAPCFVTELTTEPTQVYLSSVWLKYVAEPSDPRGSWTVSIVLKDKVRGVELPLETSFVVE
jgi:hypothetical protein